MKLSSFTQRSLHLFHLLLLCHEVAANTEIINFSSSRERSVDLPLDIVGNWSKLHPFDNERRWTLEPAALHTPLHQVCEREDEAVAPHMHTPFLACPHELWLLLDLDDEKWASYATFTLRLSWPASTPAEFTVAMYTPEELLDRLSSDRDLLSTASPASRHAGSFHPTTRSRYARIRAVHAGVATPGSRSHLPLPLSIPLAPQPQPRVPTPIRHPGSTDDTLAHVVVDEGKASVPLIVIVEPLYFSVLPATLLPTVGFLIPIVIAAALSVPYITAYFDPFIQQAREDLNTRMRGTSKER